MSKTCKHTQAVRTGHEENGKQYVVTYCKSCQTKLRSERAEPELLADAEAWEELKEKGREQMAIRLDNARKAEKKDTPT